MKRFNFAWLAILLLPRLSHAQDAQTFIANSIIFIETTLIPFLIAIAFLFFVYNVVRYFVFEGNNEDGREKAKSLAIYGVAAFVIIIIFWGVVNLLTSSIGLDTVGNPNDLISDYVQLGN